MRTPVEQAEGLAFVKALVPEADIVQHAGEPDMLALRNHDREVVFVTGGYDAWRSTSRGIQPREFDLTVEQAARFLKS